MIIQGYPTVTQITIRDEFGKYSLADGSVIYPSGSDYTDKKGNTCLMPDAGKFMLWVRTGQEVIEGRTVLIGEFDMTLESIRYFPSPTKALERLKEIRSKDA